ncbi:MAG TPA: hypothetical protein VGQ06_12660 [Gemmatimonadales bacterium]|jgi:hypothetical protein|nr:hypothetical protein [Gemmatimonadales bacterium]
MSLLHRAPVLHLDVGERQVRAEAVRRGAVVWAGEATYESPEELADVIARLAAEPAERCRRVFVTLEKPPVQTRTLTDLPPVSDRALVALVAHQAGRFFRRNGAPLVTDAVGVRSGTERVVSAAATAEPLVLAIVAGAREAGLVVESISPAGIAECLQLLPDAERAARTRVERRVLVRLAIGVVGVWLLAGAIGAVRLTLARRAVERELATAQAPLAALLEVRQELRTAEATVRAVADARRSRGRALAALVRVSAALPDSAVMTSLTWRADGSGVLTGAARRAADVLARLERSGAVKDPRIEGPVVRDGVAGREWERVTIVFGGRRP